jgi:hypothetical protein
MEKMSGVYFPYWLYDCKTDSYMNGTARDIRIWRIGDIEYTETKTFDIRRAGIVSFKYLPKTALQKAQNAMLKGIFPYEFNALESFHMGYLSGFQAEKRDIDKDSFTEEIHRDIEKYAEKRMRDTITGRNAFSVESQNHRIMEETVVLANVCGGWMLIWDDPEFKIPHIQIESSGARPKTLIDDFIETFMLANTLKDDESTYMDKIYSINIEVKEISGFETDAIKLKKRDLI